MVRFYCTQSDILLCGIASFSRRNKNKLRTFQPQKWKQVKSSQPQTKCNGSYIKKSVYYIVHIKYLKCFLFSEGYFVKFNFLIKLLYSKFLQM